MKITFFGHFGTLNSGNESSLLAILSRLRLLSPDWEFSCVCSNPEAVTATYGVEAVAINSRTHKIRKRSLMSRLIGLSEEMGQYIRLFRTLRRTDVLVVAGTGLVTDVHGLAGWGPYNLFKWTLMARLRGCKVMFVSVGAGPIDSALGRLLLRAALSLADYRSYRDKASKGYLKQLGFRVSRDRVYPDLAFSLPDALLPSSTSDASCSRVVGLGLMLYAGRYSVVNPSSQTHTAYLEALVVFVDWLLAHEYGVRLFLGDDDTLVIQEFEALLRERLGPYDTGRVVCQQNNTSVAETLSQIAMSDIVVATRFHNVLLSALLKKPMIALSFHSKCESLMNGLGLSEYIHDIHRMDAGRLIEQFQELETNKSEVVRRIGQRVEEYRAELDEQYALLLEIMRGAGHAHTTPLEHPASAQPTSERCSF